MKKVITLLGAFTLIPLVFAEMPPWWVSTGVVDPAIPADDYAAVNQGQLKNFAAKAAVEMTSKYGDAGVGTDIPALVSSFETVSSGQTIDDYAVVTLGQLKRVAKPFYERLFAAGHITSLPVWLTPNASEDDYVAVNCGQVKTAFNFSIIQIDAPAAEDPDSDHDGLSDEIERNVTHTDPNDPDSDDDGIRDGLEIDKTGTTIGAATGVRFNTPLQNQILQ